MAKNKNDSNNSNIEWDLIERDWRAGVKSQAVMAKEYGVSRAAMNKRFGKMGITRDLGGKVRAAAATIVAQSAVEDDSTGADRAPASDRDIIEANANLQSQIILGHRRDIQRSRRLSMGLLDELEQQSDNQDLIEQLTDALYDPDDTGIKKKIAALEKLTSLGSRAGIIKTLTESLRTLIALERQAFGLDDEKGEEETDEGVEALIQRVRAKNGESEA